MFGWQSFQRIFQENGEYFKGDHSNLILFEHKQETKTALRAVIGNVIILVMS